MRTGTKKLSLAVKLGVAMITGSLAFTLSACSTEPPESPTTPPQPVTPIPDPTDQPTPQISGVPNPIVAASADEIQDKFGFVIHAPDADTKDAKYSIIGGKTAQLTYTVDTGKGPVTVVYRVARTAADESLSISGDFNEYSKSEQIKMAEGQEVTVRSNDGTGPVSALWHNKE
ncbi:MAG: hypothetical protein LBK28_02440, partial [Propionibacteriaceae bacterium]|nr:hypothetical protein [Propionibacteriaceae bacterium]